MLDYTHFQLQENKVDNEQNQLLSDNFVRYPGKSNDQPGESKDKGNYPQVYTVNHFARFVRNSCRRRYVVRWCRYTSHDDMLEPLEHISQHSINCYWNKSKEEKETLHKTPNFGLELIMFLLHQSLSLTGHSLRILTFTQTGDILLHSINTLANLGTPTLDVSHQCSLNDEISPSTCT